MLQKGKLYWHLKCLLNCLFRTEYCQSHCPCRPPFGVITFVYWQPSLDTFDVTKLKYIYWIMFASGKLVYFTSRSLTAQSLQVKLFIPIRELLAQNWPRNPMGPGYSKQVSIGRYSTEATTTDILICFQQTSEVLP